MNSESNTKNLKLIKLVIANDFRILNEGFMQ